MGTFDANLLQNQWFKLPKTKPKSVISLDIKIECSADLAPKRWELQTWLIHFSNPLLMETGIGYAVSRFFHLGKNLGAKYIVFREKSRSGYSSYSKITIGLTMRTCFVV